MLSCQISACRPGERAQEMLKTRLWIPASAIVPYALLLYCVVISSLTEDRKILPPLLPWKGVKKLRVWVFPGF